MVIILASNYSNGVLFSFYIMMMMIIIIIPVECNKYFNTTCLGICRLNFMNGFIIFIGVGIFPQ